MHDRRFGWWGRITLTLAVLAVSTQGGGCRDTGDTGAGGSSSSAADRPAEILSWRHEILSKDSYAQLVQEWETYAGKHPKDARAFVEWGDALRYTGEGEKAKEKYAEAFRIDSNNAAAIAARTTNILICDHEGADWEHAHNELLRASKIDPDYPETYYVLWITALHAGDRALAGRCLRHMVEIGDMPPSLLDFGYNMLVGAPENAIILTNGDNDTYPPLACQEIMGLRPDVAIVNLSLLNTRWYIRHLRDSGVPIGLSDSAIHDLEAKKENLIHAQMQHHFFDLLSERGWPRPLLYAVTVPECNMVLSCNLSLQGLLKGVHPSAGPDKGEEEFDLAKTQELFSAVYRLDSIVDPFFDWEHDSVMGRLGSNYVHLLAQVGDELLAQSPSGDYEPHYYRAVHVATFHDVAGDVVQMVLAEWEEEDPGSELLKKAKAMTK